MGRAQYEFQNSDCALPNLRMGRAQSDLENDLWTEPEPTCRYCRWA